MSSCSKCGSEGYKSFTFSSGETVTLCTCGEESGHQALRQGSCKLPWTQDAHEFDEQTSRSLSPEELKRQTDLPASGAAEKIRSTEEVRRLALVWDAVRERHYEREITYWEVQPLVFLASEIPVVAREIVEDRSPADVTTNTTPAELKRLPWLRKQRKRAWKAAIFRMRLSAWKASIKDLRKSLDSPFCTEQTRKREARCFLTWRRDHPEWAGLREIRFDANDVTKLAKAAVRMQMRQAGKDKQHESAGCGSEELKHECGLRCTCDHDWLPYVTWRPWDDPPLRKADLELMEVGAISLPLTRILRVFGATYPQGQRFREKPIFFQVRVDAERRRFQLRSWINGVEQPLKYAKAYECIDFKSKISFKPGQLPHDTYPLSSKKGSACWKINLDYTIVTRAARREVRIDPPRYKTHDSWRDIKEHLGCSRRTAFRKIAEGFQIPVVTCQL